MNLAVFEESPREFIRDRVLEVPTYIRRRVMQNKSLESYERYSIEMLLWTIANQVQERFPNLEGGWRSRSKRLANYFLCNPLE